MPTYRIEEASTGRAGCKNKECNENKVKILKGELRLGSWVESEQFQSWAWKHWGCVTPKQVVNIQEIVGDEKDYSLFDGYDEISEENQKKIRNAVEQGHVDDEDWKGDVEMNRPGKTGFRVRVSKKKADAKKADTNDATPQKAKRSRGKKAAEESDEEEEEPVSKKAKMTRTSKRKSSGAAAEDKAEPEPEPELEKLATPPKKQPGRGRKKKAEEEPSSAEEPLATTKRRGRPAKTKPAEAEEPVAPKTAKTKKTKEPAQAKQRSRSGRFR
ncbi:hypothetical protein FQN55_007902 [Onygenales sp. PD_40]|nr:hypothetical protein FQN55_007902 [Onygenales sp. PD_40]KAK2783224.1 hypothetical protein FQN53_009310 [Emmonsiellopsis sp. PD_33]